MPSFDARTVAGSADMPQGLQDAFTAYESALLTNDVEGLDSWFLPGEGTIRSDRDGMLVSHASISAFRAVRGGVSPRMIERIEHRELGPGTSLVVAESRFADGGRGTQTQVWVLTDVGWRIAAAHVSPRPVAFSRAIWRVVGEPLVRGTGNGPLFGYTAAVKDLFAIRGHRIGAGNPQYLESAPEETDTAASVSDLLRGGADLRGIARTDEFAYSIAGDNPHYGTPPNGVVPGALPGGSSSGPASAVAAGQADIGLATDTAGSVRVPASYQGLWGLRTTHGRVSRRGLLSLAQSFDTVGWITRDGQTLKAVTAWCLSADQIGVTSRLVVPLDMLDLVEAPVRDAFEAMLDRVRATELVDEVRLGGLADIQECFRVVQAAEAWRNHGTWLRAHPGAIRGGVRSRFADAAAVTEAEEAKAREQLAAARSRILPLLDESEFLFPTLPDAAPSRAAGGGEIERTRAASLRMTALAAALGAPAISVPLLEVESPLGLAPVGVSMLSRPGTDRALVQRAITLAQHAG